jgi:hypothetical protein
MQNRGIVVTNKHEQWLLIKPRRGERIIEKRTKNARNPERVK